MSAKWVRIVVFAAAIAVFAAGAAVAETETEEGEATEEGMTRCTIVFDLKGWSALYKTMRGEGEISCDNGQAVAVTIKSTGGGLTAGKSELIDASGTFSRVRDVSETFGAYAQAEAHAGAVGSSGAQAMTKGEISLALAGTGRGFDLGFSFGKFTIKPKDGEAPTEETEEGDAGVKSMKAQEVDS
jgi:hypothetical protein